MWIQQINFHFLQLDIRVDQHFSMWNHHDQSNLLWKSVESLIFVGFKFSLISWVLITHEISVQQIMKLNSLYSLYKEANPQNQIPLIESKRIDNPWKLVHTSYDDSTIFSISMSGHCKTLNCYSVHLAV